MLTGLVARHPGELIEIDATYPAEMAERRALLDGRHGEVLAALAVSEQARREALNRIAAVLPARCPAGFARHGNRPCNRLAEEEWNVSHPPCDLLELAGCLMQENLCLAQPTDAGLVLQVAVLRAPSRWSLHEKMGCPLTLIHQPVPLYADQLSAPVDRLMRHLKPGKLAERLNGSVTDNPALFQVEGKHRTQPDPTITAANAASRLFLRVGRQTPSRLPSSGFVLFTIRVHSYPLTRVLAQPGAAARLAEALAPCRHPWPPTRACRRSGMRCSATLMPSRKRAHVRLGCTGDADNPRRPNHSAARRMKPFASTQVQAPMAPG